MTEIIPLNGHDEVLPLWCCLILYKVANVLLFVEKLFGIAASPVAEMLEGRNTTQT